MGNTRVVRVLVAVGSLLVVSSAFPPTARAAWVNAAGQFQVGGQLSAITPTLPDPTFCSQGGTSLAVVSGSKLDGVDPVLYPVALVVSCLHNSDATVRSRLNFINPIALTPPLPALPVPAGTVVKQITTTAAPSNGWAHLVNRPDQGDLLGCGNNGTFYKIDYSRTTTTADGTATQLTAPAINSCNGLTWDADADVIYVGTTPNSIVRFKDGATTLLGTFTAPCATTNGLSVSGGVLLVSCQGTPLTIHRLDKNTGASLGVHPTVTATGVSAIPTDPGLGAFACDPVTFHKDATGKDLFTDALWSRRGTNGNGVVALEFPAYTCGMPSSSVVTQAGVPYSPLAAGFGAPGSPASTQPGAVPSAACFDATGRVINADNDGLPDCWETNGIDFAGTGVAGDRLTLCVQVNTNGDGVTLTQECASTTNNDLFVEIDWMQDHKPDPKALSQTQSVASVGVKSIREAFAAAPVGLLPGPPTIPPNNANLRTGIKLHMQVDEQVLFTPLFGPPTSHVNQVAFTPCTGPAANATDPAQAVDFDTIKTANFGTTLERPNVQKLNAKRLAFRYVVFAHNLVGNPGGGSNGSGCAEIGGDDVVVTLGSFATTTVNGVSHKRGTTDQQAGTFMHEFGHNLGFDHGGGDSINCKPNYRSVMSYSRQFAGSPIPNRRLDYSRSEDPVLADPTKTGVLREGSLDESVGLGGLGGHPSLGPIPPFFPSTDQIVFGPNAWSLQVPATATPINWNRITGTQTNTSANINQAGATAGCDGIGADLFGHDDWGNVLYRASAAINFAGGETSPEMTSDQEQAAYAIRDADANGVGDTIDCGGTVFLDGTTTFPCTHRIDIPKGIKRQGNFEVVIFSERNGAKVWDAPAQVVRDQTGCTPEISTTCLTISLESVVIPLKTKGNGTCAAKDMPDPNTGLKDGIKDLHCQVHVTHIPLPTGTVFAIVSGVFSDPLTGEIRSFSARREVTIP